MENEIQIISYTQLIKSVGSLLLTARQKAYKEVNSILLTTYWHIGAHIVEFEQNGDERAKYETLLSKIPDSVWQFDVVTLFERLALGMDKKGVNGCKIQELKFSTSEALNAES